MDDLVSKDYKEVVGFTDILDFGHALPISSVEEYKSYIKRTIDFIKKRTDRISNYLNGASSSIKSPINGGKFFHQKMPKFKWTNNEWNIVLEWN